jgi:hypothetical protein
MSHVTEQVSLRPIGFAFLVRPKTKKGPHGAAQRELWRPCPLVIIGVRPDERKEHVAIDDGYRESKAPWQVAARPEIARLAGWSAAGSRRRGNGLLGRV